MIRDWNGIAFNQAPDSANQIHGDEVAKQYGFKGGLVPGVTICAYLIHPAVVAWGMNFLERGFAHVRVGSPLYDEEPFSVKILEHSETAYRAEISQPGGKTSASAEVSLPDVAPIPPSRRGDPLTAADFEPPIATLDVFRDLQQHGCRAFRYHWGGGKHNMQTYLRDQRDIPDLIKPDQAGYANMGFLLGTSNWILASNARMNPWVHLETKSQNYRAVASDTTIIAEMVVGEYGGIGWPLEDHLWNPEIRNWGYQTFHTEAEAQAAYRKATDAIIAMFSEQGLSGAIYTQTTDVEGEINGLITYDREVENFPAHWLAGVHAPLTGHSS